MSKSQIRAPQSKLTFHLPKSLHDTLRVVADERGQSMRGLIVNAITETIRKGSQDAQHA